MGKNTKIVLAIITIVIVLSGLIWVVFSDNSDSSDSSNASSSDYLKSIQSIPTAVVTTATVGVTSTPRVGDAEKNIPQYVDMIAKFGGNRFQFSQNCTQVTPSSFALKLGKQFMVDNRDAKAHVFSFAGQKYSVPDYGYAIVTASKLGDQSVFCDGVQRAKVNVQK